MANIAALKAPGSPIAIVATGKPLGIWTIEYKLSKPLRAEVSIGTPITGKVVLSKITESGYVSTKFNIANVNTGVYFVKVKNANGSTTQKVVIK